MGTIQHWQLATDILLVMSLFFLALKFSRSSAGQLQMRSQELQAGLRTLIREADKAGQSLNETLLNRQTQLEKILNELQLNESKVSRIEDSSSQSRKQLETRIEQAKSMISSLEDALSFADSRYSLQDQKVGSMPVRENYEQRPEPYKISTAPAQTRDIAPEPPSFSYEKKEKPRQTPLEQQVESQVAQAELNIYGEPINKSSHAQRLEDVVEKTVTRAAKPESARATESLEGVYAAAEKLLMAGYDLPAVAERTRLSLGEVRMLSQMVASDPEQSAKQSQDQVTTTNAKDSDMIERSPVFDPNEIETRSKDARLGVLGNMRRERQTI